MLDISPQPTPFMVAIDTFVINYILCVVELLHLELSVDLISFQDMHVDFEYNSLYFLVFDGICIYDSFLELVYIIFSPLFH